MTEDQFCKITKWQDETFPNATAESKLFHLLEEVKELHEALLTDIEGDKIESEFADCFLLLFGCAAKHGMSYEDICAAIEIKMDVNKKRKWGKPDKNGVVKHINPNP